LLDGDALTPAVPLAFAVPLLPPPVTGPPKADPDEDEDPVGKDDVGTLSGSDPTPLPLVGAI
jgi:hypothetical protein